MSHPSETGIAAKDARIATRFFPLSPALRPYVSTIYLTDIAVPPGTRVCDYLHPEWSNLRFITGEAPLAAIGGKAPLLTPHFIATGPTSQASYFAAGSMRAWGVGILPMGWAKFFALPADALVDDFCDAAVHPAFAALVPLKAALDNSVDADPDATAAMIDNFLTALIIDAPRDDAAIFAAHSALVDADLASVSDLADKLGLSERSVERLSRRAFGFAPKLLIRRQRFLRSLGRFMLDPSMRWISTLDYQYYDQAQFTRDFRRFMGMGPRDYAALPKPIMAAAAFARAAAAGQAMQGLHKPEG